MPRDQKLKWQEISYIVFRNVLLVTNGIIFAVALLLAVFGEVQAGVFLSIVLIINIALGLFQDVRAWLALKKLELLTRPKVLRIKNGVADEVLIGDLRVGDVLKISLGSEVPCDSTVIAGRSLEINEGLITGESNSLSRKEGDKLASGSVVTAGMGRIRIDKLFEESRIARMTKGIRKYAVNESPIQRSINISVRWSGYILAASLCYVIIRAISLNAGAVGTIKQIGALSSSLVPQGLVFAATLFFAYGAAHLYKRRVLLQEANATEKLGRIKNLCIDKTGTLTENKLAVHKMLMPSNGNEMDVKELCRGYILGSGDTSEILRAVGEYFGESSEKIDVVDRLSFSSWRQFGAVALKRNGKTDVVFAGLPDVFMPWLPDEEKNWVKDSVAGELSGGRRAFALVKTESPDIKSAAERKSARVAAVFVFKNNLRPGIERTINFFIERGTKIRVISGDNAATTARIAALSGIKNTEDLITGDEMANWTTADFESRAKNYTVFARVLPEQKEKIVLALKKDGFTAMIGDGANDALAIKNADLGIAMFDGAPAIRRLASVILTNNSFSALPGGVELADNIVRSLEMFAAIFFDQTFLAFFLFFSLSLLGFDFPLTPLNITLINYFTVGMPVILISYWVIRPQGKVVPVSTRSFLERVAPFALVSAIIQTIGLAAIFLLSPAELRMTESNPLVVVGFIIFGFLFFAAAGAVYRHALAKEQKIQLTALAIIQFLLVALFFNAPVVQLFFDLSLIIWNPSIIILIAASTAFVAIGQYAAAAWFIKHKKRIREQMQKEAAA